MQHLGAIVIGIIVIVGLIVAIRYRFDYRESLSTNIAKRPSLQKFFSIGFTLPTLVYYTFLLLWLGPSLGVHWLYYVFVAVGLPLQLTVAWVPAGSRSGHHEQSAYTLGGLMAVIVLLSYLAIATPPIWLSVLSGGFVAFLIAIPLLARYTRARDYLIYLEVGYFVWFWIITLLLTYAV